MTAKPTLQLAHVSFAYQGAASLFEDVSAHLTPHTWTGLVGDNGAGKTTLIKLLSAELTPTAGARILSPEDAIIWRCPQRVEHLDDAIQSFAWSWDADAMRLKHLLHLDDDSQLERWTTLSPGERKRWQIAAALHAQPDVLLLDEPTNHLDAASRELLLNALRRYQGCGLLISHDRASLDALTSQTWRLHHGQLEVYPAPYSQARDLWRRAHALAIAQHEALRSQRKAAQRTLQQARERQQSAQNQLSTSARLKSIRDSDAREAGRKGLARRAEAQAGREVELRRRDLARAQDLEQLAKTSRDTPADLKIHTDLCPRPLLLHLTDPPGWPSLTLSIERHARLWLRGDNGVGKTTLIRHLLDQLDLAPDRLVYVPQELTQDQEHALLQQLRSLPPDERARTLHVAHALGLDPDHALSTTTLSPGQARKLMIARGLVEHVWLLILDEPTNHLDLTSIERLELAIQSYPGALILVTHDHPFARATTSSTLTLRHGSFSFE
jgi:ATPase subunit of ABC transporter with duplicated ATPase domains